MELSELYLLKKQLEEKETQYAVLKAEIDKLKLTIDSSESSLLESLKANNQTLLEEDNVVAAVLQRSSLKYKDENQIISILKANHDSAFVKTSIKETLDKNPLKKALKTDAKLNDDLKDMIETSVTDYIVVTNSENYRKMLEHIEDSK